MAYSYTWSTASPVGTDLVSLGPTDIREGVKAALNERILSVIGDIDNDPWKFKNIQAHANNTYDLGTTAARFKAGYINALALNIAAVPDAGSLLLANSTGAIKARNNAGLANLTMLHMSTGDVMQFYNGAATLTAAGVFAVTTFSGAFSGTTLTLSGALTYGGVVLNAAVTGTGNMVLSVSPSITGTASFAAISATSTISNSGGGLTIVGNSTITGSLSGVTTLATSSTINSQTISATASFTGTVSVATGFTVLAGGASITNGSTDPVLITNLSGGQTTFGAVTFNNARGITTFAGIAAIASATTIINGAPTGWTHDIRINNVSILSATGSAVVSSVAFSTTTLAASGTITSSADGVILSRNASSTGVQYAQFINTTGGIAWGIEGSAGGALIVGASAYDAAIRSKQGGIAFSTNDGATLHMRLAAGALTLSAGIAATTAAFTGALTYGGVTLANSVTGTGSMVLSASPTITGTATIGAISVSTINASGNIAASTIQATLTTDPAFRLPTMASSTSIQTGHMWFDGTSLFFRQSPGVTRTITWT